ncbi:MAG: hypothetical protein LGB66_05315 [Sulfurovum sp.]|nr:hypothetical protein [Sulfurovum sp.]
MEQKQGFGGSSKGQLINEIDKHINDFTPENKKHFISLLTEEILKRNPSLEIQIREYLEKLGWQLMGNNIIPIEIFDLSELPELDETSHQDLRKAAIRFRDGDLSGSMTSICSSIDSLTNSIYSRYALGNPNTASFQERCNKSIQALNVLDNLERELIELGWETSEVAHFKKNIKDSLNKLALITQKLRSGMGDVHGSKPVLKSLVFDSFKFAQILIKMMTK